MNRYNGFECECLQLIPQDFYDYMEEVKGNALCGINSLIDYGVKSSISEMVEEARISWEQADRDVLDYIKYELCIPTFTSFLTYLTTTVRVIKASR